MFGVGGTRTASLLPEHQAVRTKYVVEAVPADNELFLKIFPGQCIKLATAGLRKIVRTTYIVAVMNDAAAENVCLLLAAVVLVISLTRYAK